MTMCKGVQNHSKYLEQTHVEEELKDGVNWNVEVDVHGHTSGPHVLAFLEGIDFLAANYSEDEEKVGGQCHDLGVNHGNGHPIVAPQQTTLGPELAKFSHDCFHRVLVQEFSLFRGLLEPIDKPGARNPVCIEFIARNSLQNKRFVLNFVWRHFL